CISISRPRTAAARRSRAQSGADAGAACTPRAPFRRASRLPAPDGARH
ncbi:MAG: hypothetical protein AVDCRST_MAG89-1690, partial [uncultured Gemmatimonadetes bacterium]